MHELALPMLGKKKTVKDHVISILSYEWPLTLKKLYNILRKKYQLEVSYQACHKAVRELLSQNVITKNGKEYQLSLEWAKQVKEFGEKVEKGYNNNKIKQKIEIGENISIITFETLFDLDKFILDFVKNKIPIKQKVFAFYEHVWVPLFHSKEGYSDLKNLKNKNRFFIVCKNDTKIDKWCTECYDKVGINATIDKNFKSNFDFLITNDIIVQLFYPQKLRKTIDEIYHKSNKIENLDLQEFFENIFEKRIGIQAIVIRNKKIANRFEEDMLNCFKVS